MFLLFDVSLMLLPFVSGHIIKQIWTDPSSKSGYMDLERAILPAAFGLGQNSILGVTFRRAAHFPGTIYILCYVMLLSPCVQLRYVMLCHVLLCMFVSVCVYVVYVCMYVRM